MQKETQHWVSHLEKYLIIEHMFLGMELTGVEPVSALSINTPLIHRFSPSNPQGGNRHLSRTVGCSG